MKPKGSQDFFAGLLFIVLGIAFAWGATAYSFGDAAAPGPGYFPFGLGVLLALLGGMVLFKSLSIESEGGQPVGPIAWRPLLAIVLAVLGFGLGLHRLGLVITVALVGFGVSFAGREVRAWEAALLGLGLALFSWLVFVLGLSLNLPVWPSPVSTWWPR